MQNINCNRITMRADIHKNISCLYFEPIGLLRGISVYSLIWSNMGSLPPETVVEHVPQSGAWVENNLLLPAAAKGNPKSS